MWPRVSRPSARIGFSENLLVAPYQEGVSLQFRLVNRRSNSLMELEAKVISRAENSLAMIVETRKEKKLASSARVLFSAEENP